MTCEVERRGAKELPQVQRRFLATPSRSVQVVGSFQAYQVNFRLTVYATDAAALSDAVLLHDMQVELGCGCLGSAAGDGSIEGEARALHVHGCSLVSRVRG